MDTSIFGLSFLSAASAKTARKTRQSPLLLCWLAHCDDVTSHDIIIILITAVTHHEELFLFSTFDGRELENRVSRGERNPKVAKQSKIYNPLCH